LETISKTYPLKKVKEVIYLNTGDIQDGKFLHNNFSNPENLPGQAKKID
jgi:type I restriction enzyme S subunit